MISDPVVRLTFRSHFDMVAFVCVVAPDAGSAAGAARLLPRTMGARPPGRARREPGGTVHPDRDTAA